MIILCKSMKGMSKMYYQPSTNQYPYYGDYNQPLHYPDYMYRNGQEITHQILDVLSEGIKREATAIDLYSRLANVAPSQKHKNDLLHVVENKKNLLNQFTNLYFSLTGIQPTYEIDKVSFQSFREGLQKAYEGGVVAYEEYRKNGLVYQNPVVQNVFLHASIGELENATRFDSLNAEVLKDYGGKPYVVDIEKVTTQNNNFRTALWTGKHLQLTLMSIDVGESIGLERHPNLDQFIRMEAGQGLVQMGDSKDQLDFEANAYADYAIFVPAGKWHNLTNTGNTPIKLYSIYAPPEHPFGTVHVTKADAMVAEENDH